MVQLWGFLGRLLKSLLKTVLPLMENVLKPLAKSVLIPLRLTSAASEASSMQLFKRKVLDLVYVLQTYQSKQHG